MIQAADLNEDTVLLAVVGQELRGDGELLGGIDLVVGAAAVEVLDAPLVLVEAAAPLVAHADGLAALVLAGALVDLGDVAGVGDEGLGAGVGLEDVHLVAAGAVGLVDVGLGGCVSGGLKKRERKEGEGGQTNLAVDEIELEALGITVTGTILGTSRVEFATTTIHQHLAEVEGAVHATGEVADIGIEGDFLGQELDVLVVLAVLSHEVSTGSGRLVLAGVRRVGHPLVESQGIALGLDAPGSIVDTLESAVLSAGLSVGAKRTANNARGGRVADLVERALEGVDGDLGVDCLATTGEGALLGGKLGVRLGNGGADLLSRDEGGSKAGEKSELLNHLGRLLSWVREREWDDTDVMDVVEVRSPCSSPWWTDDGIYQGRSMV